ncbi:MAG TPA: DNA-processing protein DprA [Candidatus Dormibacteraeota bacterium]|nr:DNA-processing protein DprA [Candidatus Dormibacteraeota bacterium]
MSIVWRTDPAYPGLLQQIHDPPRRLYLRGKIPDGPSIAIVGSRRATPYGCRIAHQLAHELSDAGIVVVSGLARGIDAAAHRGALEGATPTVAVMATGLDRIYPPEHAELAASIAKTGALVTEAAEGTLPLPGYFPVRNRIISGLSLGVVVVEAADRSGALITARMALEQGREVFCVPGSIENPLAVGVHRLIKDGAVLVQTVEDVLDEFPDLARARARVHARVHARARVRTRARSEPQDPELFAVWELLDWVEPRHHDDLAIMMNLNIKEVNRRLTLLETGGYIIGDPGAVTRRAR